VHLEGTLISQKEEVPYNYKRPATPQQPSHPRPLTSRMPHYRAVNLNTKSKSSKSLFQESLTLRPYLNCKIKNLQKGIPYLYSRFCQNYIIFEVSKFEL
jgi:hypothetical protein